MRTPDSIVGNGSHGQRAHEPHQDSIALWMDSQLIGGLEPRRFSGFGLRELR